MSVSLVTAAVVAVAVAIAAAAAAAVADEVVAAGAGPAASEASRVPFQAHAAPCAHSPTPRSPARHSTSVPSD